MTDEQLTVLLNIEQRLRLIHSLLFWSSLIVCVILGVLFGVLIVWAPHIAKLLGV